MLEKHSFQEFLLHRIAIGFLPAGAEIRQRALQEEFAEHFPALGSSAKHSYRVAVQNLSELRLVECSSGHASRVRKPTRADFESEAESRLAIEMMCVGVLTSLRATGTRLGRITRLLDLHEEMIQLQGSSSGADTYEFIQKDWEFHLELCRACDKQHLESIVSSTFWTFALGCQQRWRDEIQAEKTKQEVCHEHQFLVDSIIKADERSALAAVRLHLVAALQRTDEPGIEPSGHPIEDRIFHMWELASRENINPEQLMPAIYQLPLRADNRNGVVMYELLKMAEAPESTAVGT